MSLLQRPINTQTRYCSTSNELVQSLGRGVDKYCATDHVCKERIRGVACHKTDSRSQLIPTNRIAAGTMSLIHQ